MVIAFANNKGGTGKSTLTTVFLEILKGQGKKVLIIDCDSQCNLTTTFLPEDVENTLADTILNKEIVPYTVEDYDIVPSSPTLEIIQLQMSINEVDIDVLDKAIEPHKDNYDYILIDCPPSDGNLQQVAIYASDVCICPINSTVHAIEGALNVKSRINDFQKSIKFLPVRNNFDFREKFPKEVSQKCEEIFPEIAKTIIKRRVDFAEAMEYGVQGSTEINVVNDLIAEING
ncbi:ParA family protein [Persicobacter diffluens]|uniref:Sporulation initiation inhibitor Soj n=1 Tax=Persicobacter diffluens TaxID=981 RepID=A0AAN5ANA7_9BACT|nr:sporulation initiation inhibitor Soj [Persicobacter diffluens]